MSFLLILSVVVVIAVIDLHSEQVNNSPRIVLMTDEFDQFRRIILTFPKNANINGVSIPEIQNDPLLGNFSIAFFSIDTSFYVGKKQYNYRGKYPIRLEIIFPGMHMMTVKGKTTSFERIVSYFLFEEDQFIFDIYKRLPFESYFNENTISAIPTSKYGDFNQNTPDTYNEISSGPSRFILKPKPSKFEESQLIKAIVFSIFFFVVVIALFFILLLSQKLINKNKYQAAEIDKPESESDNIEEENKVQIAVKSLSTEDAVKQLMEKQGISYDEAVLQVNMAGREFYAEV